MNRHQLVKSSTFIYVLSVFLIVLVSSFGLVKKESIKDFEHKKESMNDQKEVVIAPELRVDQWIDKDGKEMEPVRLSQLEGKFKVIYCFQHWCPGCHSVGLPALQKLTKAFEDEEKVSFMAIQTVFEGGHTNTFERIRETQKKYDLEIPFGHDPGVGRSTVMEDYNTGGTPWYILINQKNEVEFADFHINVEGAIDFINESIK